MFALGQCETNNSHSRKLCGQEGQVYDGLHCWSTNEIHEVTHRTIYSTAMDAAGAGTPVITFLKLITSFVAPMNGSH